jgi:hypothetical protein
MPFTSSLRSLTLALFIVMWLGACGVVQVGGGANGAGANPYGYRGNHTDKATFSAAGQAATTCECWVQRIQDYETAVLADLEGVPTRKSLMGPDVLGCIAARPGMPPLVATMPEQNMGALLPGGKRTTSALFASERAGGGKMHVEVQKSGSATLLPDHPSSGGIVGASSELGRRVSEVGLAFMSSMQASQACTTYALSNAMQYYVSEHHGGSSFDLETEKAGVKRIVLATHVADGLAAASMGLLASFESAASGKGELKTFDATIQGLAAALPMTATATDAEVDAVYAQGKTQADAFEKNLKEWADEGRAARGMTPQAPRAPSSGPTLEVPSEIADATTIAKAVAGVMHGDVGAVMAGAAVLFPKDSPIRTGLEGAGAILHGDVRTALHAAAKLAPKDSKIGDVLAKVDQVVSARAN